MMKNAALIILLLAVAGLFTHSKKLSDDLDAVRDENTQLTQQVTTYQSEYADLQAKDRTLSAQLGQGAGLSHAVNQPGSNSLQGSNPLDRPPYH
jgi:uncharacterized protein YoxC